MIYDVESAVAALNEGKLVAAKTDTVFGLLADGSNPETVRKLYELKNRDLEKGCIIFVDSVEMAQKFVREMHPYAKVVVDNFWPGALTGIFNVHPDFVGLQFVPEDASIGLRMPNEKNLLEFIQLANKPLISTSCNVSGQPPLRTVMQIQQAFGDKVVIWDYAADVAMNETPSTILDLRQADCWRILREGTITKEAIWQLLDTSFEK